MAAADQLTVTFRNHTTANEAASRAAGRPIFEDGEVCVYHFPGDRQKVAVFPAHEAEPNATREAIARGEILAGDRITYAMLHSKQYRQFKESQVQTVAGTPTSELTFLTQAKRLELKALNIHTAEQLAALDGSPLKQLGPGGRELKVQAAAYLENARGSADVTAMAARLAALEQQLKDRDDLIQNFASSQKKTHYQRGVERSVAQAQAIEEAQVQALRDAAGDPSEGEALMDEESDDGDLADEEEGAVADEVPYGKPLDECSDAELKAFIKAESGQPVRGNPSRDTLMTRATEIVNARTK